MDIVILHNPHSKESRDFVAQYMDQGDVIDWYAEDTRLVDEYISNLPSPRKFPALVHRRTKVIVHGATSIDDLETAMADIPIFMEVEKPLDYAYIRGDGVETAEIVIDKYDLKDVNVEIEIDDDGEITTESVVVPLVEGKGTLLISSDNPGAIISVSVGTITRIIRVIL